MIKFNYNDGGRAAAGFKGHTSDCVTRSISIVTGLPYQQVYDDLNNLSKEMGYWNKTTLQKGRYGNSYKKLSSARTGVRREIYHKYLTQLGYDWVATMGIGTGCRVHLRADELPMGKIICRLSKHLTAVIDGVVNDTFNPAREESVLHYNAQTGSSSSHVEGRCVYGYYQLKKY